MAKQLRLLDLRIFAYAGLSKEKKVLIDTPTEEQLPTLDMEKIDKEQGIVIVFPEDCRYVQFEGNQGVGKSSVISCLIEAAGGNVASNSINVPTGMKKFEQNFVGTDGETYKVKATRTTFDLLHLVKDPNDPEKFSLDAKGNVRTQVESSPKKLLQTLVGKAGISPMWLREAKPEDQIAWLKSLYSFDSELQRAELELNKNIETTYKSRTKANNSYDLFKKLIDNNPYYKEYERWEKFLADNKEKFENVDKDIEDNKKAYLTYQEAERRLEAHRQGLKSIDQTIDDIDKQIAELQRKRDEKMLARNSSFQTVQVAEKWLIDNQKIKDDYDASFEKFKEAEVFKNDKAEFESMVENKKGADHWSDESIRLSNRLEELRKAKQDFIKSFAPEIPGFAVYIPDEAEKRHGFYVNGMTLDYLAESELWEWYAQLCAALKVHMLYIENINSLGTGAVDWLNKFILEKGGYVFGSIMNRGLKDLKVSFRPLIPE